MDPKKGDFLTVTLPGGTERRGWVTGLGKNKGRRIVNYTLDRTGGEGECWTYFPDIKTVNGIKPPMCWQSR